jgi:hypothetical protein
MPPILLLIVLIGITAGAAGAATLRRKMRRAKLSAIASSWQMRFTPEDAFQLTPRVAARFPTPGAADVVVKDLVYGQESDGCFRYFFTVEYTVGVIRTKRRRSGVAMLVEQGHSFSGVTLSPADLPLTDQYLWLYGLHCAKPTPSS